MLTPKKWKKQLQEEHGTAIVMLALAMTVVLGSVALVADVGVNFFTQAHLSVAADAAALAGGTKLKEGTDRVIQTAVEVAVKNGIDADKVSVLVDGSGDGVTVTTKAPLQLFFATIFGSEGGEMAQSARVVMARPVGMYKMFPVGIDENQTFEFGQNYKLFAKKGTTDEIDLGAGNSGALEFTENASGAAEFEYYLREGYDELISLGDILYPKSGVKYSAIKSGIAARLNDAQALGHNCSPTTCPPDCPRILYIPVYHAYWENSKVVEVEVVDFAAFWIDATQLGNGEWKIDKEINGVFIRITKGGYISEVGESPYGITSGKLVQ
ncbi:MAG: pilus assembly protein TadG-related protein [Firmicutes bacterium]|nr:pilus assembly protein TadG-related protein [Bacillota bacterium]